MARSVANPVDQDLGTRCPPWYIGVRAHFVGPIKLEPALKLSDRNAFGPRSNRIPAPQRFMMHEKWTGACDIDRYEITLDI